MIKSFLINYFGFNRQQRNGLFVLLSAIFVLFVARLALPYFIKPDDSITVKTIPLARISEDTAASDFPKTPATGGNSARLFTFDPNTVTAPELQLLGFSEKQAGAFIRYRNKGVVFRKKDDLKKVFVVSDKMYLRLLPYIEIKPAEETTPVKPAQEVKNVKPAAVVPVNKVELNSADSMALIGLPGIGPAYAKRIIKYRALLGGYTTTEQLTEVYGFPPDLYEKVKDRVSADGSQVKKIDLNTDDFKTITRHPYIGFERTKTIFAFRKQQEITLANLPELFPSESDRLRLLPYLILR